MTVDSVGGTPVPPSKGKKKSPANALSNDERYKEFVLSVFKLKKQPTDVWFVNHPPSKLKEAIGAWPSHPDNRTDQNPAQQAAAAKCITAWTDCLIRQRNSAVRRVNKKKAAAAGGAKAKPRAKPKAKSKATSTPKQKFDVIMAGTEANGGAAQAAGGQYELTDDVRQNMYTLADNMLADVREMKDDMTARFRNLEDSIMLLYRECGELS